MEISVLPAGKLSPLAGKPFMKISARYEFFSAIATADDFALTATGLGLVFFAFFFSPAVTQLAKVE